MPEMYTVQKMVHIRILEFADHTRLIIKTTVVRIFKHCGKAFTPLELPKMADLAAKLSGRPTSSNAGGVAAGAEALSDATGATNEAAYTAAEYFIGMVLIGLFSAFVLFVLTFIGIFVYRRVTRQVEYMSIKQEEAGLDGEEEMGEAAPAYDPSAAAARVSAV